MGSRISGPQSDAIKSGLASAVITGLALGFGGGKLLFGAWIVCYIFFISFLNPSSMKYVAIVLMLVLGSLIGFVILSLIGE